MTWPACDCGTWDHRHEPRCHGTSYDPSSDPLRDPADRWDADDRRGNR